MYERRKIPRSILQILDLVTEFLLQDLLIQNMQFLQRTLHVLSITSIPPLPRHQHSTLLTMVLMHTHQARFRGIISSPNKGMAEHQLARLEGRGVRANGRDGPDAAGSYDEGSGKGVGAKAVVNVDAV